MKSLFCAILLSAGALASPALPPYTREVLANGAVVYLMPKRDVPLVNFRAVIRGGSEADPAGKAGLASITAEMLSRGTAKRSADEYAGALEFFGSSIETQVTRQATSVQVETLAENAGPVLDLVLEAVLEPALGEAEFTKLLARTRDEARQLKDVPQAALPNYFRTLMFGPLHPYGHAWQGDEVSLSRITHQEVRQFYHSMYVAPNLTFIVVGDFDPPAMKTRLTQALGRVRKGAEYRWKNVPQPPASARLLLVDKPDATQTYFEIGHAGINRTNPDRVAVMLVNTLFGGRFTSMLNDALRVSAGLTYGAGSRFESDRLRGAFVISSYTQTADTVQAIDMALDVLHKMQDQGISAGQLASAKAYLKGTFPTLNMETSRQLSALLAEMESFGLSRSEYDDFFARVDAVTLEQANAAVKKYFGSEDLRFALLGNASAIRDQVKRYAPEMTEVKATAPGYPAIPQSAR